MSYIDIIYPCVDATDSDAKWQIGRKEAEKERSKKKKKEDRRKRSSKKRKGGKRGERKEGNGGKKAKQAKQAKGGLGWLSRSSVWNCLWHILALLALLAGYHLGLILVWLSMLPR